MVVYSSVEWSKLLSVSCWRRTSDVAICVNICWITFNKSISYYRLKFAYSIWNTECVTWVILVCATKYLTVKIFSEYIKSTLLVVSIGCVSWDIIITCVLTIVCTYSEEVVSPLDTSIVCKVVTCCATFIIITFCVVYKCCCKWETCSELALEMKSYVTWTEYTFFYELSVYRRTLNSRDRCWWLWFLEWERNLCVTDWKYWSI